MRTLYPPIEPYRHDFLEVDSGHKLYFEESGNPDGNPVIFLHGGPGSGTKPSHRCFFDPDAYRIILLDQRGCGKSTPHGSLINNTTTHLVEDLEKLRDHLEIERWVVFGGSWGSSLALAYAQKYPQRVKALLLRGIFLCRKKELNWLFRSGAHCIFPEAWEKFLDPIPPLEREDLVAAYYKRLTSMDPDIRKAAAKAWSSWEAACVKLKFDPNMFAEFTEDFHAEAIARIECHYFIHNCFFPTEKALMDHIQVIHRIPGVIVQGRYDMICPMENAYELHKAWPIAKFEIIPDGGHSSSDEGMTDALVRAADDFRNAN